MSVPIRVRAGADPIRPRPAVRSPLRRGALAFIETYRLQVAPRHPARCRFHPSCSEYGRSAFIGHNFLVAVGLTIARILRCSFSPRPSAARRSPTSLTRRALAGLGVAALAIVGPAVPMSELLGGLGLASAPAAAASTCAAGINGTDANQLRTPQTAYTVQEHTQVAVDGSDPALPAGQDLVYKIQLQFYYPWGEKVSWTVADGDSTSQNFAKVVDVDKYATKSTGLYLVHVVAFGSAGEAPCQTDAFIKVVSSKPSDLETAAAVLGVGGLAGTLGAGLLASREGSALSDADVLASQAAADDAEESMWEAFTWGGMCAVMAPLAMTLTIKALMSDLFHHAVAHLTRSA